MLIEETKYYWIWNNDTLVFKPEFNKPLDNYINIVGKYDKLYFLIMMMLKCVWNQIMNIKMKIINIIQYQNLIKK